MTGEIDVWDKVRDTRNPYTEEYEVSGRFPFGLFKKLKLHWTASGRGEADARYRISVSEHRPKGAVAAITEPDVTMTAILAKTTPAWEGYGAQQTTYVARLAAGELVAVHGHVVEFNNEEGEPVRSADGSTIATLSPEEAQLGFQNDLAVARFD